MNSKELFSNRVDTYVKYRPSYPKQSVDYLYDIIGVQSNSVIADIGAGTGIFTKLLLERGSIVHALEPNQAMREVLEKELGAESNFHVASGSAEVTELPDQSLDYIVCAQAFHWFDREATKAEFKRILKPNGKVILIWNTRQSEGTPFREQYDQLLHTFGKDYKNINHKNMTSEVLMSFFEQGTMQVARFTNGQTFDYEGLSGRMLSSSYIPVLGEANYEWMMTELRSLFDKHQQDGEVLIEYETELFWGEV